MKLVNLILRLFVGGLYIFSGLIKLNDPHGTAYKLEEYFEVFAKDFSPHFLELLPYSLWISLFICAFEVILGVAIIINYRMKLSMWIAFLLILFFTFLTYYAYVGNKVKECGCFGDFIKLTPKTSYYKDLVLLALTLVLLVQSYFLVAAYHSLKKDIAIGITTIISFFIGYYAIEHLPYFDFLPFKVGNNIPENMKPKAAPKIEYIYSKEGKQYVFKGTEYPKDKNGNYDASFKLDTSIITNPEEAYPKIQDYNIWNDEGNYTDSTFTGAQLLIVFQDVRKVAEKIKKKHIEDINTLVRGLQGSTVKVIAVSSSTEEEFEAFRHEAGLAVPYYFADNTLLKTMIRSNPGIMLIKDGTVKGKWHHNDVPAAEKIKSLIQ